MRRSVCVTAAESISQADTAIGRNSNSNYFLNRRGIETLGGLTGKTARDEEVHAGIQTPFREKDERARREIRGSLQV